VQKKRAISIDFCYDRNGRAKRVRPWELIFRAIWPPLDIGFRGVRRFEKGYLYDRKKE
jgi:hypothetical protein